MANYGMSLQNETDADALPPQVIHIEHLKEVSIFHVIIFCIEYSSRLVFSWHSLGILLAISWHIISNLLACHEQYHISLGTIEC